MPHSTQDQMPRYFFNVLNAHRSDDQTGIVLPDLESARSEALKDIDDILRQDFQTIDTNEWATWSIEICDECGTVLLVVPFSRN